MECRAQVQSSGCGVWGSGFKAYSSPAGYRGTASPHAGEGIQDLLLVFLGALAGGTLGSIRQGSIACPLMFVWAVLEASSRDVRGSKSSYHQDFDAPCEDRRI